MPSPIDEDRRDLLLSCRYGDLADVQAFVTTFSPAALDDVHDDHGNTVLHMAAGNGHIDVLAYLLSCVPPRLVTQPNYAGSIPLHWAALNAHMGAARALVGAPRGPGADMIGIKNAVGRSPLGEAEMAGWDEGARWFVEVMKLDETRGVAAEGVGDGAELGSSKTIEVDVQDAGGQMAIHPDHQGSP